MNPETRNVADHMKDFSFHLLGKSIFDAAFSEMTDPFAHVLSIIGAAQGAEILVKARIAQEHPLLIFSTYPKSSKADDQLTVGELFSYGVTLNYSDLPEALWATTGYRMKRREDFIEFGRLRNGLIHFAAPQLEASARAFKFVFEVMDQMAYDFWSESFIDYALRWDDGSVSEAGLLSQLQALNVKICPATRRLLETWL